MSDGITITLLMTFKDGMLDSFTEGLGAGLKETAAFPGFRSIRVVRHKEAVNQILFIEQWDSEQTYQAYIDWRTKMGVIEALGQMLATPPKLDIWPSTIAVA